MSETRAQETSQGDFSILAYGPVEGEAVVHEDYGIGIFRGLARKEEFDGIQGRGDGDRVCRGDSSIIPLIACRSFKNTYRLRGTAKSRPPRRQRLDQDQGQGPEVNPRDGAGAPGNFMRSVRSARENLIHRLTRTSPRLRRLSNSRKPRIKHARFKT